MLQDTCITICEKPYFFKRYKNRESIDKGKQLQKENKELIELSNKSNQLEEKKESLETRIALQTKRLDLVKKDKDKLKILDCIDGLLEERDNCVEELNKIEEDGEANGLDEFNPAELEIEMYATTLDMMLANFDKEDFIENSTPYDVIVAKNINVFYTLAMAGKNSDEIAAKVEEVVEAELSGSESE